MKISAKKKIKRKLIKYAVICFLLLCAVSSVVGPVRAFTDKCASFFSFGGVTKYITEINDYYTSLLANIGIVGEELENLPFDEDIIMQAIAYDINGGNIKYQDGQEVWYQSYETRTETTTTTETVETLYKHFDGESKPNRGSFINAGCDNYSCQVEITVTGIKFYRYICKGHTKLQEIEHSETLTRYLTYGHYFKIVPSEYLCEYDMPWNVILALAVVQRYAYDGELEIDDYTGDLEEFKYSLTQKGIRKIHNMFSSDEGVGCSAVFSYIRPYAYAQEDVNKLKSMGNMSDEQIEASDIYKMALLTEEDVLLKGTYWYEAQDSAHPSLMMVITDVYNYIWHYHFEYDVNSGSPVFVRGSRTSRVAEFRDTLKENHFDDDSADLLIPLVEAMPNGEETARTLEFLFDYYDEHGREYAETLYDGLIYKMKEERCELIKEVNEQIE
jgi:hypothetical protein